MTPADPVAPGLAVLAAAILLSRLALGRLVRLLLDTPARPR